MQDGDVPRIEGAVIGRTVPVTERGDAQRLAPANTSRGTGRGQVVRAVEQRRQLGRGRDTINDELIVTEATDHVEVDHGDGAIEWQRAVGHEILGAEKAHLFATEGDEEQRPSGRRGGEEPRELEYRGGPGRVVVGTASNGALALRIERPFGR